MGALAYMQRYDLEGRSGRCPKCEVWRRRGHSYCLDHYAEDYKLPV